MLNLKINFVILSLGVVCTLQGQETYFTRLYMGKAPAIDTALVKRHSIKEIRIFRNGGILRSYLYDRNGQLRSEKIKGNVEYLYQNGQKYRENNFGEKPPFGRYALHEFADSLITITYFSDENYVTRSTVFKYLEASRLNLQSVTTIRNDKEVSTSMNHYDQENRLSKNEFSMTGPILTIKEHQYPDSTTRIEKSFSVHGTTKTLTETTTIVEKKMANGNVFHSTQKSSKTFENLIFSSTVDQYGQLINFEIIDEDKGGKGEVTFLPDGRPQYISWHGENQQYRQHFQYSAKNGLLEEIHFQDLAGNLIKQEKNLKITYWFYQHEVAPFPTMPLPFRFQVTSSYILRPN